MAIAVSTLAAVGLIEWGALTADRLREDVLGGIGQAKSAIAAVAAIPLSAVTFENCIEALERATEPLDGAWGRMSHLNSHMGGDELRAAYGAVLDPVSEFYGSITLNDDLWQRVRALRQSSSTEALSPIRKRLLEETARDFLDGGADLSEDRKARLLEIRKQLSQKTRTYMDRLQDATDGWELLLEDPAALDGLPPAIVPILRAKAAERGHESAYCLTLHEPIYVPAMRYLHSDSLRRTLWSAYNDLCSGGACDNCSLVVEILALRREEAQILGYENFADYVLSRRMAGSGGRALRFTEDMERRLRVPFREEFKKLQKFKRDSDGPSATPLEPWDMAYYGERQCRALYGYDGEQLRPYLQLEDVLGGLFALTERLFGLRAVELPTRTEPRSEENADAVSVWHRDVRYFTLFDGDGSEIGGFYVDLFPRDGKRTGAWENELVPGRRAADGSWIRPIGTITANLTPPTESQPSRLTRRDMETIFHEFGHLLHSLLGRVDYASLNGTSVACDFVEMPSQLMENWTWNYDCLRSFARDRSSGEVLPEELFRRMEAARNYQVATGIMVQLSRQKMDLDLHMFYDGSDLDDFIRKSTAAYVPQFPTVPRSIVRHFHHLFGDPVGYAAGYYSYKWSEVLDADAFERFLEEGLFSRDVANSLRREILERGGSEAEAQLYRNFRGRDADPNALLRRDGLLPPRRP